MPSLWPAEFFWIWLYLPFALLARSFGLDPTPDIHPGSLTFTQHLNSALWFAVMELPGNVVPLHSPNLAHTSGAIFAQSGWNFGHPKPSFEVLFLLLSGLPHHARTLLSNPSWKIPVRGTNIRHNKGFLSTNPMVSYTKLIQPSRLHLVYSGTWTNSLLSDLWPQPSKSF